MKLIYFANDGKSMSMDIDEQPLPLKLPIVIKYNAIYDTLSIMINPDWHSMRSVDKNIRKKRESVQYVYATATFDGKGFITQEQSWEIILDTPLTEEMKAWYDQNLKSYFKTFINNSCTPVVDNLMAPHKNLGYTFFLQDISLTQAKDCTIHLYGKGHIYSEGLSNVLVYVRGDYAID